MKDNQIFVKHLFSDVVPKTDGSPSDCQDTCAFNDTLKRYAIADGVTLSFLPAEWSRLLVNRFCDDNDSQNIAIFETQKWEEWLTPIQGKWYTQTKKKVEKATGSTSYHLRNSLAEKKHAAATFVGLHIDVSDQKRLWWQAMLIGDSCLFHVRGNKLISYLKKNANDFNNNPDYFASIASQNRGKPEFVKGDIEPGDFFILATDALAKWILNQYVRGGNTWRAALRKLKQIQKWRDLFQFVEETRNDPKNPLDDDDVALTIISVTDDDKEAKVDLSQLEESKRGSLQLTQRKKGFLAKESTNDSKTTVNISWIIGTGVSLILCIIALALYLSSDNFDKKPKQVSRRSPVVNESKSKSQQLAFPVSTQSSDDSKSEPDTTDDFSKPETGETTNDITHKEKVVLYAAPDKQKKIIEVQDMCPDSVEEQVIDNQEWSQVKISVWINEDKKYISVNEDKVFIKGEVSVYASFDSSMQIGKLFELKDFPLDKIDEKEIGVGKKYHIRVPGYKFNPKNKK